MKIVLDIVLQHTGNFGEENLCPMFSKDYSQPLADINASMKLHPETVLPSNYFSLPVNLQYPTRLGVMKNTQGENKDTRNTYHHYAHFDWDNPTRWWGQIAGDCVDLNTENPRVTNYLVDCYTRFIEMGVDAFRIDTGGHISRLTFNKAFVPQLLAAGEKYKAKRGGTPFYMYSEVCARSEEVIYRGENYNCSPCFYTWKETKDYAWDYSETSWDSEVVMEGETGSHTNALSVLKQADDYMGQGNMLHSSNAWLSGNDYRAEDYSLSSGLNVIDFPMHWRFHNAPNAFGVHSQDDLYNDARWNVVYVDSHDYAPNGNDKCRFSWGQEAWAENLSLMFTWRGIPCIYYGSEIEFRAGKKIDEGPNMALIDGGRAYFGGYIDGEVQVSDFADYSSATGNMAVTLSHPLALHIQRLNKIRAAVPALRKGQYSVEGCAGRMAFKRRYTDSTTDSYVLVTVSGDATFTGILNGTYTDVVTGDTRTVTNGSLSVSCPGKGNMRAYVLSTTKTPAPGKIGSDGKYLYNTTSVETPQGSYDGNEEALDLVTQRPGQTPVDPVDPDEPKEPEEVTEPSLTAGEQAVFFENSASWSGTINCYCWNGTTANFSGAWPGATCTYLGNNVWKWSYSGSGKIPDSAGVIFNNGSTQTDDLKWVNGGYYNASGYVRTIESSGDKPIEPGEPEEPEKPVVGEQVVYFENTASWNGTIYCYGWNSDSENFTGTWPGATCTYLGDNIWKWTYTGSTAIAENAGVIFNNGSSQTDDFKWVNGGYYNASGYVRTVEPGEEPGNPSEPEEPEKPVEGEQAVYFENSASWGGTINCYSWNGDSENFAGAWPGSPCTYLGDNVWKWTYTGDGTIPASAGVIFNNGSSQTDDFKWVNGGYYNASGYVRTIGSEDKPVEPEDPDKPVNPSEKPAIPAEIQEGNILHCFDWKFSDIEAELADIAKAGFGAIQVSPVQGNSAAGSEWFYAYLPYDYALKGNGNGSPEELRSLCEKASAHGIKIIVDVVANHVNKAAGYHDTWWDSNGRVRWNGGIDYNNRYSITHNQLGDYGDINSEDQEVQARAKKFIEELSDCGVKGIRWDAAKHIGLPSEGCGFWSTVTSVPGMYHYGEILDSPGGDGNRLMKEYTDYISVTDSKYSESCLNAVCNGSVPAGFGNWAVTGTGIPDTRMVYWAESHDTYSNNGQYGSNTSTISQDKIDRAWALTACRNGATSLYFSRPPATNKNDIKMGQKGSTHFTAKEIAAVNSLRNKAVGHADYYTGANGVASITREGVGACIVVGAGGSREVSVANGGGYVPVGTYTDIVDGSTFTVTATTISGRVGSTGIAVIYTDSEPSEPEEPGIPSDMPESFYILGSVNGNSWASDTGVQMDADGDTFVSDVTFNDEGTFSFTSSLHPSWAELNASGHRYGAGADTAMEPGVEHTAMQLEDPKAFRLSYFTDSKVYTVRFHWPSKAVSVSERKEARIDKEAWIDSIPEGDDSDTEYYNLQGVRVHNPSPGLYIVKHGMTVSKQLVR